jgi:hypothetical protein
LLEANQRRKRDRVSVGLQGNFSPFRRPLASKHEVFWSAYASGRSVVHLSLRAKIALLSLTLHLSDEQKLEVLSGG